MASCVHAWQLCTTSRSGTILSRFVEKLIVRKFIIPAYPFDLISDQFAYRPTASISAAFISLTHYVAQKLESCNYVRCLQIDYVSTALFSSYILRPCGFTSTLMTLKFIIPFRQQRRSTVWPQSISGWEMYIPSIVRLLAVFILCELQKVRPQKYGLHSILQCLAEDIQMLEDKGIQVTVDGNSEVFLGSFATLSADNLASHEIEGFRCCFSSGRICRFCMVCWR